MIKLFFFQPRNGRPTARVCSSLLIVEDGGELFNVSCCEIGQGGYIAIYGKLTHERASKALCAIYQRVKQSDDWITLPIDYEVLIKEAANA